MDKNTITIPPGAFLTESREIPGKGRPLYQPYKTEEMIHKADNPTGIRQALLLEGAGV
jgi:hypothetical protein